MTTTKRKIKMKAAKKNSFSKDKTIELLTQDPIYSSCEYVFEKEYIPEIPEEFIMDVNFEKVIDSYLEKAYKKKYNRKSLPKDVDFSYYSCASVEGDFAIMFNNIDEAMYCFPNNEYKRINDSLLNEHEKYLEYPKEKLDVHWVDSMDEKIDRLKNLKGLKKILDIVFSGLDSYSEEHYLMLKNQLADTKIVQLYFRREIEDEENKINSICKKMDETRKLTDYIIKEYMPNCYKAINKIY
jgi:hypothetical protein